MVVFPSAKINLGLHVLDKRADGFHNLETIFYPIALTDSLEVQVTSDANNPFHFTQTGIALDCSPEKNLCYKAYLAIKEIHPELPPMQVHLHKTIPTGAGLGGGSSDGAFMLNAINRKFELNISNELLAEIALSLGSDCPFFLINSPALAYGRGEMLHPIPLSLNNYSILLINPGIHINTGWAFGALTHVKPQIELKNILEIPIEDWKHCLVNHFETPVFSAHPEIASIKNKLYEHGAIYASMSGSGSSVFGIFPQKTNHLPLFPDSYFCKWV
jgi:4-diphosphocytidyl-2-C-methyl-D-erythritol kinase